MFYVPIAVVVVTLLNILLKVYRTEQFKLVNVIIYKLYFKKVEKIKRNAKIKYCIPSID